MRTARQMTPATSFAGHSHAGGNLETLSSDPDSRLRCNVINLLISYECDWRWGLNFLRGRPAESAWLILGEPNCHQPGATLDAIFAEDFLHVGVSCVEALVQFGRDLFLCFVGKK